LSGNEVAEKKYGPGLAGSTTPKPRRGKPDGDRLVVEVFAARLGSALDSFLSIHDGAGQVMGMSDDIEGGTDSRLEFTAAKAGVYFAVVSDANDQGGPAYRYRVGIRKK